TLPALLTPSARTGEIPPPAGICWLPFVASQRKAASISTPTSDVPTACGMSLTSLAALNAPPGNGGRGLSSPASATLLPLSSCQMNARCSPSEVLALPTTKFVLLSRAAAPLLPPNVPRSIIVLPFQKNGWNEPEGVRDSP